MRPKSIDVPQIRGQVHVAIITIRHDEYDAVESILEDPAPAEGGNNSYEVATIHPEGSAPITVALTRCVGQGNLTAQAIANNIIYDLDPSWLLLVGIAGGTPDYEYSLGDVILASALHDFSFGASAQGGARTYQAAGGPMHAEVGRFLQTKIGGRNRDRLLELAGFASQDHFLKHPPLLSIGKDLKTSLYGDMDFQAKVEDALNRRFPGGVRNGSPRVWSGPCANGNLLVKDAELLTTWQQFARQVVNVETELAGVYEAARTSGRQNYPVLAIRGLSDIVGLKRNPDWTQYACDSAAAMASAILRSGFIDFSKNLAARTDTDAEVTPSAVRGIHESITQLEQRLMDKIGGLPAQVAQAASPEDQRLLRAFRTSQKAEAFLRERFRANGRGLGELLRSVSTTIRNFDHGLAIALEKFAPVRNSLMHEERPSISTAEIDRLLDELDAIFQRHIARTPSETSLALPPRQWFVSKDGFGEFTYITEALLHSGVGDHIFVLPGSYDERVCIEKPIFLLGKGESPDEVTITTDGDLIEIGARDVVVSNMNFETRHPHAFGVVVLPSSDRIRISQCAFVVQNGEGLVALHATGVTISECNFEHCRVAVRLEANAIVTQCTFAQNDHGLLVRNKAVATIEKCSFSANQFDIELRGDVSAQVNDNEFQAGTYAIGAVGQPTGRIFGNRFTGYDVGSRLISMNDTPKLMFEE